jgi:hypothetical protein
MSKKTSNLISTVLVLLLVLTATFSAFQIFTAKVYGAATPLNSVSMSPMTLTLPTLPLAGPITYWVNVTSNGATSTDYINSVNVSIPTGWTYTSGAAAQTGYGFTTVTAGSGWVNFTTTLGTFYGGAIENFSIPISAISAIPTGGVWTIYCYQGSTASSPNPVSITVTVNLQFHATMVPIYGAGGATYVYSITTTNDLCPIGIEKITITFPTGAWLFNVLVQYSPATETVVYSNPTFTLTGPNILEGNSTSIMVNMTIPAGTPSGQYAWTVVATDSNGVSLGTYTMQAVVDSNAPTFTTNAPTVPYYSVGSGNHIWINVTVTDLPFMATYFSQYTVTINDTRFAYVSAVENTATSFFFYYENVTAIPDGNLVVKITAVDPAGNTGNTNIATTVDNTAPQLISLTLEDQLAGIIHQDSSGTFWMKATTTAISVKGLFYNLQTTLTGEVYINGTGIAPFTNNTWIPGAPGAGYSVPVGANLAILNITVADASSPTPNNYTFAWNIKRELTAPSAPSYTKTATICGGFIIWGLTATDIVGINSYNIYLNGTLQALSTSTLNSSTLTSVGYCDVVQNVIVFNLFGNGFASGAVANITITAVNYGSNVGNATTFFVTVPAGQWYAIQMLPEWNLISFPLLPNSTATANIFSNLLVNGAAGVNVAYSFNDAAKTWTLNPTTMTDGNGYWIYMKSYDVLIVQGYPVSAPPGNPPPVIAYSLTTGWNLAGFTETTVMPAWQYVASLQSASYFRWLYAWNPSTQQWVTIDTATSGPYIGTPNILPGQGFFILMYSNQTLVPPA